MISRRGALHCLCGFGLGALARGALATNSFSSIPMKQHEIAMRAAIAMALQNPVYPFGAVITNASNGRILARGVNKAIDNPTLHGEITCINNYVSRHGNKNWSNCILYTTGEPCPMCMSALIWANIGSVVYGSSMDAIQKSGIDAFTFSAKEVNQASNFSQTVLLGGILEPECNALFANRNKIPSFRT